MIKYLSIKEIAIVENENMYHITLIKCPLCNDALLEGKFTNHLFQSHALYADQLSWRIQKRTINIDEIYSSIKVEFELNYEEKPINERVSFHAVIEDYYTNLASAYKNEDLSPLNSNKTNDSQQLEKSTDNFLNLTWEHVIFGKDRLNFNHPKYFINSIACEGIVPELNQLKDSYFRREHNVLLKFLVNKGMVDKSESPGWHKIVSLIDLVKAELNAQIERMANNAYRIPVITGLSNEQIIAKYSGNRQKSYFVKLLSGFQDINYQVVPIIERRQNLHEVSFIFTIANSNKIFLIWENCLESRGTHIFRCEPNFYKNTVEDLKSYIQNPNIFNKRQTLWQNDKASTKIKNKLKHYKSFKHTNKENFMQVIQFLNS